MPTPHFVLAAPPAFLCKAHIQLPAAPACLPCLSASLGPPSSSLVATPRSACLQVLNLPAIDFTLKAVIALGLMLKPQIVSGAAQRLLPTVLPSCARCCAARAQPRARAARRAAPTIRIFNIIKTVVNRARAEIETASQRGSGAAA